MNTDMSDLLKIIIEVCITVGSLLGALAINHAYVQHQNKKIAARSLSRVRSELQNNAKIVKSYYESEQRTYEHLIATMKKIEKVPAKKWKQFSQSDENIKMNIRHEILQESVYKVMVQTGVLHHIELNVLVRLSDIYATQAIFNRSFDTLLNIALETKRVSYDKELFVRSIGSFSDRMEIMLALSTGLESMYTKAIEELNASLHE